MNSVATRFRLAVVLVAFGLVVSSCSGDSEALSSEEFCSQLPAVVEDVNESFKAEAGDDVEFDRAVEASLRELATGVPKDAPESLEDLMNFAADGVELSVRVAEGEDRESVSEAAKDSGEEADAVDWDPAESWVESTCGIEVLAIELRVRGDDRVVSASE